LRKDPGLEDRPEELGPTLRRIAQQVQRGRTITDRFLKVARPGTRSRTLVDVNLVVQDTLAFLSHHAERCGIETRLELSEGMPPLRGDESVLGQVVMNLMLNAIQAMSDNGGTLRIATASVNGAVTLEVEDTGCGMTEETLKRIYEPFFTTKPTGKGTGLGLFVTHRIVSEWNGRIQVRSDPGRGTLFLVRIPIAGRGDR
jgi:two-component system NtrC family sensor kinase